MVDADGAAVAARSSASHDAVVHLMGGAVEVSAVPLVVARRAVPRVYLLDKEATAGDAVRGAVDHPPGQCSGDVQIPPSGAP